MKKILSIVIFIFIFLTSTPNFIYAQPANACPGGCSSPSTCQLVPGGNSSTPNDWACISSSSSGGSSTTTSPTGTVDTGLGPIPTDPQELVKWVLGHAIIIGGGIAFLLSLWGGITIILAGGNPEKINEGKEIITSAISGILFIVFSVFLLRFIGVDILQIPGFSK